MHADSEFDYFKEFSLTMMAALYLGSHTKPPVHQDRVTDSPLSISSIFCMLRIAKTGNTIAIYIYYIYYIYEYVPELSCSWQLDLKLTCPKDSNVVGGDLDPDCFYHVR